MHDYTIQDFWKPRLSVQRMPSASLIGGWSFAERGLSTFKEAPLDLKPRAECEVRVRQCANGAPMKKPIGAPNAPLVFT